jgi:hypothetical protein
MTDPFRNERDAALARAEQLQRDNDELRNQLNALQHGHRPTSTSSQHAKPNKTGMILALGAFVAVALSGAGGVFLMLGRSSDRMRSTGLRTTMDFTTTRESTGIVGVVRAVQTINSETWAVGDHGAIAYRSREGIWQATASGVSTTLRAITRHGSELIAVGDGGTMLLYNMRSHQWQRIETGTHADLYAVASGAQQLYVAGSGGTLLRCEEQGTGCAAVPSGVSSKLNGLTFSPTRGQFFAVGDRGVILTWTESTPALITRQTPPTEVDLRAVIARENGDMIAVGNSGAVLSSGQWGSLPWVREQGPHARDLVAVIEANIYIEQRYENGSSGGDRQQLVVLASDGTLAISQQGLSQPCPPWYLVSDAPAGLQVLSQNAEGFVAAGLAGQAAHYRNRH